MQLCKGITKQGLPCKLYVKKDVEFCVYHEGQKLKPFVFLSKICVGVQPNGVKCTSLIGDSFTYCYVHRYQKVNNPKVSSPSEAKKRCAALLDTGERCLSNVKGLYTYCYEHRGYHHKKVESTPDTCLGFTISGLRCRNRVKGNKYCKIHQPQDPFGDKPKGGEPRPRPPHDSPNILPSWDIITE